MARAKAVATVEENFPTERPEWMGDTNRGNEGVTVDDMTIPRLSIIQDLSPQHKKSKPEYIEGAEPRMVFNTVTQELYGDVVLIVPVMFRKEWVIWKDIDLGGGFKGAYPTESEANAALSELEDSSQCEVVDTAQHFVLVVDADTMTTWSEAVISMNKSQMKPSRQLNSIINGQGGDRWERMFRLEVVEAQNAAGQEYYNWKPKQMGYVSESIFKAAEKLYDAVKAGVKDVKRDTDAPLADHGEGEVLDSEEF